jgi:hypothetical protein
MWNWGFRGCKQQLRPCKLNSVHSAKAIPPKGDEHPLGLAEGVEPRTPRPFRRSSWSIFIVDGFCRTFGHDGAIQCCQVGLLKNLVAADSLGSSMIRGLGAGEAALEAVVDRSARWCRRHGCAWPQTHTSGSLRPAASALPRRHRPSRQASTHRDRCLRGRMLYSGG